MHFLVTFRYFVNDILNGATACQKWCMLDTQIGEVNGSLNCSFTYNFWNCPWRLKMEEHMKGCCNM